MGNIADIADTIKGRIKEIEAFLADNESQLKRTRESLDQLDRQRQEAMDDLSILNNGLSAMTGGDVLPPQEPTQNMAAPMKYYGRRY